MFKNKHRESQKTESSKICCMSLIAMAQWKSEKKTKEALDQLEPRIKK